jgi:putative phosphoesterase
MNILAVSDPHGDSTALRKIAAKSKKADIVLIAGDITIFERDLRKILSRLNKIKKPVLVIPGNHESPALLKQESERFRHIYYIESGYYMVDNYLFVACAGNGFALNDPEFVRCTKKLEKTLKAKRKKIKDLKYILMTHALPYRTKVDYMYHEHFGNKSVRDFISKTQPDLAICGHFHETFGKRDKIKKTVVMNPGPFGKIVRL